MTCEQKQAMERCLKAQKSGRTAGDERIRAMNEDILATFNTFTFEVMA